MTDITKQAIDALIALEEIGALEPETLGSHGGIPEAQEKARNVLAAYRAQEEVCFAHESQAEPAPAPSTCPHDGQCHPGFCPCKEGGK